MALIVLRQLDASRRKPVCNGVERLSHQPAAAAQAQERLGVTVALVGFGAGRGGSLVNGWMVTGGKGGRSNQQQDARSWLTVTVGFQGPRLGR